MSLLKHPQVRYRCIDNCLRNPGKSYTIDNLLEECNKAIANFDGSKGVEKRTIYKDINYLDSIIDSKICEIKRIRDGHQIYFRYSDLSYSINNQPVNEMEAIQLKEALFTLSRFKGMPQFEWIEEISVRLDSGLGLSNTGSTVIESQQNEFLKGRDFIGPIYNAIIYEKSLNITYKSFTQAKSETFILHPYYLKEFNNRWFIFGKKDGTNFASSHYALDRIVEAVEAKKKYIKNKEIDFTEYFNDIVGVTIKETNPIETIVLKVKNERLPYIQTKPLHGSQSNMIDFGKTHSIITLKKIRRNPELESLILSYGDDIEIIEPKIFRNDMKKRVKAMFDKYN